MSENITPEVSQADLDSVMRKYDRESNTRIWTGKPKIAITLILAAFSIWCIYVTLFATFLEEIRLTSFMALIILMGFLIYPDRKDQIRPNYIPIYDIIYMIAGSGAFLYYTFNANQIINQGTRFEWYQIIIGIIGILALVEITRRCVGIPILCVAGFFLIYALSYGLTNPAFFGRVKYLVRNLFYTKEGILATPVNVCSKYIVVFIIFGAFLERTGISNFFIDMANSIAGRFAGGPAKVAVISSALCGMVSGSSVGNTVTTGSVTIPMMKKTGYQNEFMADFIGVPYADVIKRAVLPAVLYFFGIFITVHLEAKRLDLHGVPKEELPKMSRLIRKIYLLIPLVALIFWVSTNAMTMQRAASLAIVLSIVVGFINRDAHLTPGKILDALSAGGRSAITVGAACGVAGIISGTITMTGLANELINAIVGVAGDKLIIALVLTMLCCIVLGMGVPTTANYCIMAATTAPILIRMGVPIMAAHFFVFYFGIVADITPPVALAAYAGSAIAKSNPMKTAFTASRLAIAATITAVIGIFGVAAGMEGYCFAQMNIVIRLVEVCGGLMLIHPSLITDLCGLALVIGGLAFQYMLGRKK